MNNYHITDIMDSFSNSKDRTRAARAEMEYFNGCMKYRYAYDIYEAYEKPSAAKVRAWEYCKQLCSDLNGYGLTITAHGTFTFSVCFRFLHPETGKECFAYITRDYNSFCEV